MSYIALGHHSQIAMEPNSASSAMVWFGGQIVLRQPWFGGQSCGEQVQANGASSAMLWWPTPRLANASKFQQIPANPIKSQQIPANPSKFQ